MNFPSASFTYAFLLAGIICLHAANDGSFQKPDSLLLKDGRTIEGLIISNTADSVIIQQQMNEETFSKKDIVRIRDEANIDILFTDIARRGDLPPWRVIANDLRTMDQIKSLIQIPATPIAEGPMRQVPYLSFAVNDHVELNIYGDPEDPAGIEFGIYGEDQSNDKMRRILRAYLAGFLTMRSELRALYDVDFSGGITTAGDMRIEVTPKSAPDSYGAWWISLYNAKDMEDVRLDAAEYARLTVPVSDFRDAKGRLKKGWTRKDLERSERIDQGNDSTRVMHKGFYRDKQGIFRLLGT